MRFETDEVRRSRMKSRLTAVASSHAGLQLLDLFHQQGDVLQQVFVLQQQLVNSGLSLQTCSGLGTQLVLQQVNLPPTHTAGQVTRGPHTSRTHAHAHSSFLLPDDLVTT